MYTLMRWHLKGNFKCYYIYIPNKKQNMLTALQNTFVI